MRNIKDRVAALEDQWKALHQVKLFECTQGVESITTRLNDTFEEVQTMCRALEESFQQQIIAVVKMAEDFKRQSATMLIYQEASKLDVQQHTKELKDLLALEEEKAQNNHKYVKTLQKSIAEQLGRAIQAAHEASTAEERIAIAMNNKVLDEKFQILEETVEALTMRFQSLGSSDEVQNEIRELESELGNVSYVVAAHSRGLQDLGHVLNMEVNEKHSVEETLLTAQVAAEHRRRRSRSISSGPRASRASPHVSNISPQNRARSADILATRILYNSVALSDATKHRNPSLQSNAEGSTV